MSRLQLFMLLACLPFTVAIDGCSEAPAQRCDVLDPEQWMLVSGCGHSCPPQFEVALPEVPFPDEYREARRCIREYWVRCNAFLSRDVEFGSTCDVVDEDWAFCVADLEEACPDIPWRD